MIQIPTPSINANKMAPTAADLTAADGPPTDDEKYCQDCSHVCAGMVGYCVLFLGKSRHLTFTVPRPPWYTNGDWPF